MIKVTRLNFEELPDFDGALVILHYGDQSDEIFQAGTNDGSDSPTLTIESDTLKSDH